MNSVGTPPPESASSQARADLRPFRDSWPPSSRTPAGPHFECEAILVHAWPAACSLNLRSFSEGFSSGIRATCANGDATTLRGIACRPRPNIAAVDAAKLAKFEGQIAYICLRWPRPLPDNSRMYLILWRPRRDLNPCYRRERAVSWAGLDDGDAGLRAPRTRLNRAIRHY